MNARNFRARVRCIFVHVGVTAEPLTVITRRECKACIVSPTSLLFKHLGPHPKHPPGCFFLQLAGTAEWRDLGSLGTRSAGLVDCDERCRQRDGMQLC
jgi:hypothetical protein